jgi:hypothetical protein
MDRLASDSQRKLVDLGVIPEASPPDDEDHGIWFDGGGDVGDAYLE